MLDVAIAAPYEDDGSGVVYIYHGVTSFTQKMIDKYAQKITGIATCFLTLYQNSNAISKKLPCCYLSRE